MQLNMDCITLLRRELEFLKKQMEADVKNAYKVFPFDDEGKNALHYAAIRGDIETFKMIESYFPKIYQLCFSKKWLFNIGICSWRRES